MPATRVRALSELAIAVAATGDHDRTAHLAREISNPHTRVRALSELAIAVAAIGDHDRTAHLAREISNPDIRVRALRNVALRIIRSGGGKVLRQGHCCIEPRASLARLKAAKQTP